MDLAPYASDPSNSKGRVFEEPQSSLRNDYQRDRDRIIHSASFRRLQYKTQVFVNHEGDMFRSRLTHSLEVSQISRGVARTLHCHEDLVEAISLAHDLGHTPFGHSGQDALNECMRDYGGFEHNLQSLRVVDLLENRYGNFAGLNLCFEVREGILKHCSKKNAKQLGGLGLRFLDGNQPSLEAQIVNFTDEIAYIHHDIDDGFRSKILNFELLNKINLFKQIFVEINKIYINLTDEQMLFEILRRMMNLIISDLCQQTALNIKKYQPLDVDDVRQSPPLVQFSKQIQESLSELKKFSRFYLYQHERIKEMSDHAHTTIKRLFFYLNNNYERIPASYRAMDVEPRQRVIADYIAGMTDRYANQLAAQIES